jgi:hypothetical protein
MCAINTGYQNIVRVTASELLPVAFQGLDWNILPYVQTTEVHFFVFFGALAREAEALHTEYIDDLLYFNHWISLVTGLQYCDSDRAWQLSQLG